MGSSPASPRQESARRYYDDYERRLAAEIVAMLREARGEASRVLTLVHAILNLTLEPRPSEPRMPTLRRAELVDRRAPAASESVWKPNTLPLR